MFGFIQMCFLYIYYIYIFVYTSREGELSASPREQIIEPRARFGGCFCWMRGLMCRHQACYHSTARAGAHQPSLLRAGFSAAKRKYDNNTQQKKRINSHDVWTHMQIYIYMTLSKRYIDKHQIAEYGWLLVVWWWAKWARARHKHIYNTPNLDD